MSELVILYAGLEINTGSDSAVKKPELLLKSLVLVGTSAIVAALLLTESYVVLNTIGSCLAPQSNMS